MQISSVTPTYRPPVARAAQAPVAQEAARPVRAADGPPPEYSLWAILKDIGNRIGAWFKGLLGRD